MRRTRCAVLGSPIGHSLSPVMHRAAYASLGLEGWSYDAYDVDEAALGGFLSGLGEDWRGLSLTMPLKRAVIPHLATVSETAAAIRAVNTVIFDDDAMHGHNTDVPGMVAALRERGVTEAARAVVVGAGATAASAVAALRELGVRELVLAVRERSRAVEVESRARDWDIAVRLVGLEAIGYEESELLISTIPADAAPTIASLAEQAVSCTAAVFDVAYGRSPTPLEVAAKAAGTPAVTGLDLLAHQAALQVELMTGAWVSPDRLRDAVHRSQPDPR